MLTLLFCAAAYQKETIFKTPVKARGNTYSNDRAASNAAAATRGEHVDSPLLLTVCSDALVNTYCVCYSILGKCALRRT
jgi:hypothetical protein